ncbi:integral membrane protein [soil metagenome]
MTSPRQPDRLAAERWFLRRGLPSVLTKRARWRRLWTRSAPALAALATLFIIGPAITLINGGGVIDIDGDPTPREWVIIALLLAALPLVFVVTRRVSRISDDRGRTLAGGISVAVCVASDFLVTGPVVLELVGTAFAVSAILVANGLGVGAVIGWGIRLTLDRLTSVGALFARALPVVLLTVLVFFNGYVWSMAASISRDRMWLVILFMTAIAVAFLSTGIVERVRPILASTSARDTDAQRLTDTPFAAMPDPAQPDPPDRGERINVVFVLLASQLIQILTVAVVTGGIFLAMGLIALSPDLLDKWTLGGSEQGTWMSMTLPIPQALIHVSMFLTALTFMYVSARSVGDGEYRSEYLDPLIDDLRLTLVARSRYRAAIGIDR